MKSYASIMEYINAQSPEVQAKLREMNTLIKIAAPKATGTINYGIPTYRGNKDLVHFAAMKGHLGFYPAPSAIAKLAALLTPYSTSKGCVRFLYNKPLPKELIKKMTAFREKEDSLLSK